MGSRFGPQTSPSCHSSVTLTRRLDPAHHLPVEFGGYSVQADQTLAKRSSGSMGMCLKPLIPIQAQHPYADHTRDVYFLVVAYLLVTDGSDSSRQ